jgi:hypothetical protein
MISYPGLIDGISYVKIMICLILAAPILVFLVSDAYKEKLSSTTKVLGIILLLSILGIFYFTFHDYRSVFGAPGRNNGLLSIFLAVLFVYFGVFIHKHGSYIMLLKAIIISSTLTSTISLLSSFQIVSYVFPSLHFESADFRDNTNHIAPLFAIGLIAAISITIKFKNPLYLLSQLPAVFFVLNWSLLQSFVASVLGILILIFVNNRKLNALVPLFPFGMLLAYICILVILSLNEAQIGGSVLERLLFIEFAAKNFQLFSFLPINIDGLSDYSSGETFLSGSSSFLDDFHNVFLQAIFSYGIILGVFFFLTLSAIFLRVKYLDENQKFLLPLFTAFYVTLYFGILSANYMYFGFTILGFLISGSNKVSARKQRVQSKSLRAPLLLLLVLPISVSAIDINNRFAISSLTFGYEKSPDKIRIIEEITSRTEKIEDAGYRFYVARNLFVIGECLKAEALVLRMTKTNSREVRLSVLKNLSKNAACVDRG